MVRKIYLLFILLATTTQLFAQTQRFETTVSNDTSETDFGKNKKNNVTFIMQMGAYILAEKTFRPYYSSFFDMSLEYNHKVSEWYSYGLDFSFDVSTFVISKTAGNKSFPDTIIHHKENVSISSLGLVLYQRFNFFNKHRGEIYGNYLDLGIYGNIHIVSSYYYQDKNNLASSNFFSGKQDVYFRSPDFLNVYDYGVTIRIGRNWFSLFARYRLSNLMKDVYKKDYSYPNLPNLAVGTRIVF